MDKMKNLNTGVGQDSHPLEDSAFARRTAQSN